MTHLFWCAFLRSYLFPAESALEDCVLRPGGDYYNRRLRWVRFRRGAGRGNGHYSRLLLLIKSNIGALFFHYCYYYDLPYRIVVVVGHHQAVEVNLPPLRGIAGRVASLLVLSHWLTFDI